MKIIKKNGFRNATGDEMNNRTTICFIPWLISVSLDALQLSTIWQETVDNARSAARIFVLGGLSEKNYGLSVFWVIDWINVQVIKHMIHSIILCLFLLINKRCIIQDVDTEALTVLNNCYERAKKVNTISYSFIFLISCWLCLPRFFF